MGPSLSASFILAVEPVESRITDILVCLDSMPEWAFLCSFGFAHKFFVKERFSPCNLYYMGAALHAMGKKEEAIKNLIAAYRAHAHNEHELKVFKYSFNSDPEWNTDTSLVSIQKSRFFVDSSQGMAS